jgi:hypothetical protein
MRARLPPPHPIRNRIPRVHEARPFGMRNREAQWTERNLLGRGWIDKAKEGFEKVFPR